MAKISELSDGGSLLPTDFLIAVRSGGNVKVQADTINVDQIDLGDNEKIRLGNSQDLEIYHDGTNSYITNATNDLLLDVAGDIILDADGGDIKFKDGGTEIGSISLSGSNVSIVSAVSDEDIFFKGNDGGSSIDALFLDMSEAGAATFNAGADFGGTVTTDGLTVGTSNVVADVTTGGSTPFLRVKRGTTSQANLVASFHNDNDAGIDVHGNGDISFYEDTGTTAKLFWDASAESLGIGTSSPSSELHVKGTDETQVYIEAPAGSNAGIRLLENGTSKWTIGNDESNDGLFFYDFTAASERLRIDSSGNLLVGTTNANPTSSGVNDPGVELSNTGGVRSTVASNPAATFNRKTDDGSVVIFRKDGTTVGSIDVNDDKIIFGTANAAIAIDQSSNIILPYNPATPGARDAAIDLGYASGRFKDLYLSNNISLSNATTSSFIQVSSDVFQFGTSSNDDVVFYSNNAEAMRIDASGNLLVGTPTTVGSNDAKLEILGATGGGRCINTKVTIDTSANHITFHNGNGQVGSISTNASATAYNTSSDQRLKDNIVDAPSASDDIDAIQVRSFDWKADGSHQKYGMVAQELVTVAPEAVSQPEDPEEMMGVDYSKLVPMMLKEIQSLRARVAQLEGAN